MPGENAGGVPGFTLDTIDLALIEQLQDDGRASFRKLAQTIGIPEATARRRVTRLIDDGVVRVLGVLNTLASERTMLALIEIDVDADLDKVAQEIAEWEEATWVAIALGSASILVEVACDGRDGLLDLVRRTHQIAGARHVRSTLYLKVVKALYAGPPPGSVL